jgi:tape measure domain-containing protein
LAQQYSVDIVAKVLGGQAVKKLERSLEGTDKAAKQLAGSTGRASNGIRKLGNSSQQASGKVNKLGKSIRNVIGGLALLNAARFVFGKTAELERTTKQLATVTGSLKTAKGILAELQVINKKSPFSFIELADTAKRLSAFGIENGKLVQSTERLGKAAAATGARVNDLALAYGQVRAKGKLQTEELYQFQERGIPLLAELAKGYGVAEKEVANLIETGQVGFPAVEQAIKNLTTGNGKFAKAFENTANTLDAKLSNAIDSLGRAAAAFGELLKPKTIEILQSFEKLLVSVTGFLKGIPQPVVNAALKLAEFAAKAFLVSKAIKAIIALKLGITGVLAATATSAGLAGNASLTAAGKVNALAASLGRLAAIGIVTVGVNYVVNGVASGGRQEDLLQGLETGAFDNTLQNQPYEQAQAALRQEEATLTGLLAKRDKLQKELKDSAGGFLSLIPGVGAARIGAKKGELNEVLLQIQKSQRILSSKTAAPPKATEQTNPFELLDGNGKGNGKGKGASAAAKAERERQRALEEAQRLIESQREAYASINQELDRSIALGSTNNSYIQQGLQNQFEYEDVVKRINAEVAAGRQAELTALAQAKKDQADLNVLRSAASDFGSDMGEFFAGKLPEVNDELTKTEELLKGSFDIISGSLTSGIQGLIKGTKDLNDILSDMLSNLGNMFLNAAFSSLGAGLKIPGFADGGRPEPNKLSVVGERGPELFIPDSAGTVIPNDAFADARGAMSGGSSPGADGSVSSDSADISSAFAENTSSITTTNSYMRERSMERSSQTTVGGGGSLVVETQVINNVEYATVEQMQLASAASAKQARAEVFRDLRNKPAARASVGMR